MCFLYLFCCRTNSYVEAWAKDWAGDGDDEAKTAAIQQDASRWARKAICQMDEDHNGKISVHEWNAWWWGSWWAHELLSSENSSALT
eukprot:COSAG05_NODE_23128_length_260_cov_0.633540_1_plen_86_part_11